MWASVVANKAQHFMGYAGKSLSKDEPPSFCRKKHCPQCAFQQICYLKPKETDRLNLLGGISLKVVEKYYSRGVFTITQLSHLFRPKRRGRNVAAGKSLWELKALAIREKKTFVLQHPDLITSKISIYMDFEGLLDENFYYLLGVLIRKEGNLIKPFHFG